MDVGNVLTVDLSFQLVRKYVHIVVRNFKFHKP